MIGEIRLPNPHKGQRIVRTQARRFNWLAAGRRWRKTTLGVPIVIEGALKGEPWFWGAPTYDQVRIAWEEAKYACAYVKTVEFKQSTMTATFKTGGRIIFRSLDLPNNARGHSFFGAVFDETADIKESAYYDVVAPILGESEFSQFWGLGTPDGRNWFWREWMKARDKENSMSWSIPTLGARIENGKIFRQPHPLENPDYPWAEIVRLFYSSPELSFRQEILAEFVDNTGSVFRQVKIAAVLKERQPENGKHYVAAADIAAINDYTVVTVIEAESGEMVYKDRFTRVDYPVLEDRLAALYDRWWLSSMTIEENSIGMGVIDHLRERGLNIIPFLTTNATKQVIIQNLQSAFEHGKIKILDDDDLVAELLSFEAKRSVSGKFVYGAPSGMLDDCVMSLAMTWDACGSLNWMPAELIQAKDPLLEMDVKING